MNKIFKGTILSLLAVAGLVSCTEDFEYTPAAAPSGVQVYFSSEIPTEYTPQEDANSFTIPLNRANVAGELTVPLTVSGTEGTIYTISNSVSFNDGDATAAIVVNYDPTGIEYGRYDTLTIAIDAVEMTTPYAKSTITVVAGVTAWVDYGTALYREDLMTTFWNTGNPVYSVPIQKNIVKEGYYRLVNPYGKYYPFNEDGDYDPATICYMTINATDPDWVYVEDCETTMDWGDGVYSMLSYVYYFLINGNDMDVIKANRPDLFGTLKDGIITMPTRSMLISNDEGMYYANLNGLFAVALPGAAFADYSVEVTYSGVFTDARNNVYAVGNLTLGEDAKTVKAIVMNASDDAAAVADAIAAGDLEAVSVSAGRIEAPIAEGLTGKLQLIAVVLDGGTVKALDTATFEYYGSGGVSPWKSLGIGIYVDDFVVPLFTDGVGPYAYEVEIQESTETPGLYRMVDAYAPVAAAFGEPGGHENIEIHAENPNGVYILEQRIGMDFGYGDMSIVTEGGDYVGYYGDFGFVYQNAPQLFGTLENGVITFPSFYAEENGIDYQGYLVMGSSYYYAGMNASIALYLPSALQSNAKLEAKVETLKKAAKFERCLKANKKAAKKRPFSKKLVKAAKKIDVFKL